MSSALSKQIHSINFSPGEWDDNLVWNTWDRYHLVPSSRPVINPPEVRTMYVDVPGVDGVLDLTTSLTNSVLYKNREGSLDFVVANDYEDWTRIYHKLMNDLHGKLWLIQLCDDPGFYYRGRISVNEWKSERNWSKVTLDYHLDPYKYEFFTANEPWEWDPFSFTNGIIRNYGAATSITVDGYTVIEPLVVNGDNSLELFIEPTERITPLIIWVLEGSTNMSVKIGGGSRSYPLNVGQNNMTTMYASEFADPSYGYIGDTGRSLKFSGTGSIWVQFQGGWL